MVGEVWGCVGVVGCGGGGGSVVVGVVMMVEVVWYAQK